MGTNYFVCGGPFRAADAEAKLFGGFERSDRSGIYWNRYEDGELVYVVIDGIWIITGDSDLIFEFGQSMCEKLSASGVAGEFHAQTTGGYYQIVRYENGKETDRQFQFCDAPQNPRARVVHNLSEVALWDQSRPMLPVSWEEIEQSEGVWLKKSQ